MENKHKHYDMIVAKAANMDLVVMEKHSPGWIVRMSDVLHMNPDRDYFLCLPQHKEAVLHWLNGGEVQTRSGCSDLGWDTLLPFEGKWNKVSHFMCVDILIRIKPKKEKRWIIWDIDKGEVHQVFKRDASGFSDPRFNHSMHEIEIEV